MDNDPIKVPAERTAKELASRCGGARLANAIVDLPVFQGRCSFIRLVARLSRSGGVNFEGLKPWRRLKKLAFVRHIVAVNTLEYLSQVFLIRYWQLSNHLLSLAVTEGGVINHGIICSV